MTRLNQKHNWGAESLKESPKLVRQLDDIYTDIANKSNGKSNKNVTVDSDPPADSEVNANFDLGDVWVRSDNDTAWIMTSRTSKTAVNWKSI